MKKLGIVLLVIGLCVVLWMTLRNSNNLDYVKQHGPATWQSVGFEPIGYEGYQYGAGVGTYGGANVWWTLRRVPDNGLLYNGYLQRWGNELHVYSIRTVERGSLLPAKTATKPTVEPETNADGQ